MFRCKSWQQRKVAFYWFVGWFDCATSAMHLRLRTKDNVKKKYLNDRVYSLVEHFKNALPEDVITNVYLLGKRIDVIPLTKQHIATLNEWSVPTFIFRNGEFFDIDYVQALLFDVEYHDTIRIANKHLTHVQLNTTKRRTVFEREVGADFDLEEYIGKSTKGVCLIHGVSSITKNTKPTDKLLVFTKQLTEEQIFDEYTKNAMLQVHAEVQDMFNHLANEKMMHRILIGKDIQKAIKLNQIQTPPK